MLKLADLFTKHEVSFKQIFQQKADGETARVVIITHRMNKLQLAALTAELEADQELTLLNSFKVLGA